MEAIRERFSDLLKGARVVQVHPVGCAPFTCIRETVNSGVEELMRLFDNDNTGGVTSGGSMAYVVEICVVYESVPVAHFEKKLGC